MTSDPNLDLTGATGESEPPNRRLGWLIAVTAVALVACLVVTYILFRAVFPGGGAAPTIPWTTLTPVVDETSMAIFATPSPTVDTSGCEPDAEYVADVTIPDNTAIAPGETFLKVWRVRNSGTCPWVEGYTLRFAEGAQMSGPATVPIPAAAPGEVAELSVNLVAPTEPGTYRGNWQLCVGEGTCFGPVLYVQIVAGATPSVGITPSAASTATATTGAAPTETPTTAPPSPQPSASPEPSDAGASAWLVNGNGQLGVREVAWDQVLGDFEAGGGEIYLSLYIVAEATGEGGVTFNPLDIAVVDDKGDVHGILILERKDPAFSLCTARPDEPCEGWWTTVLPNNDRARRDLVLRWEPGVFASTLETPIRQ